MMAAHRVKTGVEVLCATHQYDALLRGKRIGLITAPTGVDAQCISTIDLLHARFGLSALFSPEHGVRGNMDAGCSVDTYTDIATGLPVYSLYRKDSKRLTPLMLQSVDVMVYDIQDVGSRYFTFLYTLLYALQDCARAGIPFVVLDRPNPLGGVAVEGNLVRENCRSFVGDYPLCNRYGLTIGEFAFMVHAEQHLGASLTVVPCAGWKREMLWPQTQLLWIAPSPALTCFEAAFLYSGTCLFEGTNLSEGRGTAAPFRWIGAPYLQNPTALAKMLNEHGHAGIFFRPLFFTPLYGKHAGLLCGGVELHLTDARTAQPLRAALDLLYTVRQEAGDAFQWSTLLPPATRAHIDLIAGCDALSRGQSQQDFLTILEKDECAFRAHKKKYHLYE
ncbi:MAG: DUF1343 domain-containing protein [Ruthenibacterium sp.]